MVPMKLPGIIFLTTGLRQLQHFFGEINPKMEVKIIPFMIAVSLWCASADQLVPTELLPTIFSVNLLSISTNQLSVCNQDYDTK